MMKDILSWKTSKSSVFLLAKNIIKLFCIKSRQGRYILKESRNATKWSHLLHCTAAVWYSCIGMRPPKKCTINGIKSQCWPRMTCNPNIFYNIMVGFGILLPKLFWPTVRKNCSSDREKLLKFEAEGLEFSNILRSLEQFIQRVKVQNNLW